ncbi:MAG: ribosomal protein S18-alanine N-acetyltransferase [Proteobacteria bacterium]|jgi:[ribosomal protein S18]-alanine N-acetyltransferase|nr:ribosomal protein S18-alanine N-acetyltransferase [Pseudomonadota bacterium]MDA1300842.1 ribosomal protein S18-alanine N-acetyltransferase [Pseudomonadota bacterium]
MATVALDHEFRRMNLADVEQVLVNERRGYTHPWTAGIFRDCIKSGYECWLLHYAGHLVGHGILSMAAGESHLLNVCVHPDYQGNGLGRRLVEHMVDLARAGHARSIFLEVRSSNGVAYGLYESMGFNEIGIRPNYYPSYLGREDARVLAMELIQPGRL